MTLYIGADLGKQGGLAIIDTDENIRGVLPMPIIKGKKTEYDIKAIINWFNLVKHMDKDIKVFVEKQYVRPMNGIRAGFMLGFGYGLFQGILQSLNMSYEIVSPNEWMKVIFKGMDKKDKKLSVGWCQRKYPNYDFRPTRRCTKVSDGITDACAIAVYGKRTVNNK